MTDRIVWGGRYEIHEELASGGMATVFVAARLGAAADIPRVVALKRLSSQFAKQPEFVAMFLDEAHLAARIRHPNVVATYEFLRTDEGLGIIMDLVIGESFVQLLRGDGPRPPLAVSTAIVVDALEGLHAAHQARDETGRLLDLVHRDVSPHNIIVGADGVSRVIDFGIAKAAGRLQTTDVGVLKGKFAYMAPEQVQGAAVDARTDIYAAGIVLWEAVTGRRLFEGGSNEELLTQRISGGVPIPLPSTVNPALTPAFDRLILRALETDPAKRYPSARAMADALRAELPCAERATVAAWVEEGVGPKLEQLAAMARRITEAFASPGSNADEDVPDLLLPGKEPTSRPASSTSRQSSRRFGGDLVLDDAASHHEPGPSLELEDAAPHAASRKAAIPRARDRPLSSAARLRATDNDSHPARLTFLLIVIVLALGLGGVVVLLGPGALKGRVIAAASGYGLALSVDRVALAHGGLLLSGVRVTPVGSRSFALTAAQVDVETDRLGTPQRISFSGYDLTCTGAVSDLVADLARWRRDPRTPLAIDAKAGHVVWNASTIPSLSVEALDVTLAVAPMSDASVTLDTASLLINLPRGHLGPWHAHVESSGAETRARIGLDPSAADGPPSVTYIGRQVEGSTWSVDIPRGSSLKVGMPPQVFGLESDLGLEVALRAHVAPTGQPLAAEARVGLYGLWADASRPASAPLDLVISGNVEGVTTGPLAIAGARLMVGKATAFVSGTLVVKDDGLRIELERPASRGVVPAALVFDTRQWTSAASAPRGASPSPTR